jgi:hypothetical protein
VAGARRAARGGRLLCHSVRRGLAPGGCCWGDQRVMWENLVGSCALGPRYCGKRAHNAVAAAGCPAQLSRCTARWGGPPPPLAEEAIALRHGVAVLKFGWMRKREGAAGRQ